MSGGNWLILGRHGLRLGSEAAARQASREADAIDEMAAVLAGEGWQGFERLLEQHRPRGRGGPGRALSPLREFWLKPQGARLRDRGVSISDAVEILAQKLSDSDEMLSLLPMGTNLELADDERLALAASPRAILRFLERYVYTPQPPPSCAHSR